MRGYTVTCDNCKLPIEHICEESFKEALVSLLTWVPEGFGASEEMAASFKAESERQGDEYDFQLYPFYGSQAWTYLIFHKEDARTFHALLSNLMRAAGVDPSDMDAVVSASIEQRAKRSKTGGRA